MATEIESAWSPAKRFTLVKPTFKGLEQAFIPRPAGSGHGPVSLSGNGDLAVLGNPAYPWSGATIHHRENSTWSLKATISSGISASPSGGATDVYMGSSVWFFPDGDAFLIGSVANNDDSVLVGIDVRSRVWKFQKQTLVSWTGSVEYPEVSGSTYRFMNSSSDNPQYYHQIVGASAGWVTVFGGSYQTTTPPTVSADGTMGAVSIPSESKIVAVKKVGSSYNVIQNIVTTAGVVAISYDGSIMINGYGDGVDFYSWSGASWIFTRRVTLSSGGYIGLMKMSKDTKTIAIAGTSYAVVLKNVNGSWIEVPLSPPSSVFDLAISQDGSTVAISGSWNGWNGPAGWKIFV